MKMATNKGQPRDENVQGMLGEVDPLMLIKSVLCWWPIYVALNSEAQVLCFSNSGRSECICSELIGFSGETKVHA